MSRAIGIALGLSLLIVGSLWGQALSIDLDKDWTFKAVNSSEWLPATVPGTVQEDLMALNQLPDPFVGTNEDSLIWVEESDWLYKTAFTLSSDQLAIKHHTLVFHGLDTYAEVRLNGEKILASDNMFRTYKIDISHQLQTQNTLEVLLHSPIKKGKAYLDKLPYNLPADSDVGDIKVMPVVRKAAFHFGWDWGPRIVNIGNWRPIQLISHEDFKIESLIVDSQPHEIGHNETESIKAHVSIGDNDKQLLCLPSVNGTPQDTITLSSTGGDVYFQIDNPQYWWPNGLGNQVLYDLTIEVMNLSLIHI